MVRRTGLLGDVVDEDTFARMCNTDRKQLRTHRTTTGSWLGVDIPAPITRLENLKPIWLKREAEDFAVKLKAARAARGR
jgi:hypothetical protein